MECQNTTSTLKINLRRNIGTVVIFVEGENDECEILKQIFRNVLHYRYIEKKRNRVKINDYDQYVMRGNENSQILVINLRNSNIQNIVKDVDYQNQIFKMMYEKYHIDIKNVPIYFLWDRDYISNRADITKKLLKSLGNAYENNDGINGLLLLSYPCIQSYILENFKENTENLQIKDLKKYLSKNGYRISEINTHTLLKSVNMLHNKLMKIGIKDYDPSNFSKTNMKIFEYEENFFSNHQYYKMLSLVSIILIDLNIITERP